MARVRPPVSLLGTAPRAVAVGREVDLHHGERLRGVGRGRQRWQGVRLRPDHVLARLPYPAPACDGRRCSGEWLLSLELTGQLRVDLRLRQPLRIGPRRLQDAKAYAETERAVVSRGGTAQ